MMKLAGFLGAAMVATLSGQAVADELSPLGMWAPPNQESRYEFATCGDGNAVCARLAWIRPDKQTDKNMKEMGKLILDTFKPKGTNTWAGKVHVLGHDGDGVMTMVSTNHIHVKACTLIVICQEIDLEPAKM
jgi:uncharacterized protein (DUF2147 family)